MSHPARPQDGVLRVVIVGGGIAGAEAMLALRALAGDRVSLTLVAPNDELVLPALLVAEPFALGHAGRYSLAELLAEADAERVAGSLAAVEPSTRQIRLDDGTSLGYDALILTVGARAVARVEHASTWDPHDSVEMFGGLLRDLEHGYTKRVAFVIPTGAVWPLPAYELAMMTSRQVWSMGIDDAQITLITPEAIPLAMFGSTASVALREELQAAGVRLETATVARVAPGHPVTIVLQPTTHQLEVDRVIALPGLSGPDIPGTARAHDGFIAVTPRYRMRDSENVWAAGDAIAYPVKFGGLAAQQADIIAADIASQTGVQAPPAPGSLRLSGVLMTGATPRPVGRARPAAPVEPTPLWQPSTKMFGTYLTPYVGRVDPAHRAEAAPDGLLIDQPLPSVEQDTPTSPAAADPQP